MKEERDILDKPVAMAATQINLLLSANGTNWEKAAGGIHRVFKSEEGSQAQYTLIDQHATIVTNVDLVGPL